MDQTLVLNEIKRTHNEIAFMDKLENKANNSLINRIALTLYFMLDNDRFNIFIQDCDNIVMGYVITGYYQPVPQNYRFFVTKCNEISDAFKISTFVNKIKEYSKFEEILTNFYKKCTNCIGVVKQLLIKS